MEGSGYNCMYSLALVNLCVVYSYEQILWKNVQKNLKKSDAISNKNVAAIYICIKKVQNALKVSLLMVTFLRIKISYYFI